MDFLFEKLLTFRVIASIAVSVIAVVLYAFLRIWTYKYDKKHRSTGEKATLFHIVFGIFGFLILFIGFLIVLEINGVNITALAAGLGIVSAIVGLALQDYLKDIIMGIHILSDHFFLVGECVEYDGREGKIIAMTLKTTKIEDLDDRSVITVCNRNISQIRRLAERLDIDIPLSYNEDMNVVQSVLRDISALIAKADGVRKCEFKGTQMFDSSAIIYRLRLYCEPALRADVRRTALSTVQRGLCDAGISIPFNQLDVHLDKNEPD